MSFQIHFIDHQEDFDRVMAELARLDWVGFDTEFVGEKTYIPVLCLIQVVAGENVYLIDTLKIKDLRLFLGIVEDPAVLKVTHAGDNDYRLLNTLFGTVPQNTFDTQIAAGFVGYNYPAGFAKICERELRVNLAKSHTVADWEARPIDPKALNYAVEDVKYLPALHQKLSAKLARRHRTAWAREENRKWETANFYVTDPYREALGGEFIYQLDSKEKLFLLRIYVWRREKAAALNVPRETVLQGKHIGSVVKAMKHGLGGFKSNRTLPENVWKKHFADWENLYKTPPNPTEKAVLDALPQPVADDPEREWMLEFLYMLVRQRCVEHEISAALLLPKGDFNKLKTDADTFDHNLLGGWRAELLGPELTDWLKRREAVRVSWPDGFCKIEME
ncbi:MAG: ribonuclease D [Saprospiraceae bacterium]